MLLLCLQRRGIQGFSRKSKKFRKENSDAKENYVIRSKCKTSIIGKID